MINFDFESIRLTPLCQAEWGGLLLFHDADEDGYGVPVPARSNERLSSQFFISPVQTRSHHSVALPSEEGIKHCEETTSI